MPTDYKYIDHERASARRNWRARFALLLIVVLFLTVVTYGFYFFQTRNTDELILTGKYSQATGKLNHWTWLPLVNGRVYEKLGTAKLLEQGSAAAAPLFNAAESKPFFRPVTIWQDALKILWTNGRYEDGAFFAGHVERVLSDQPVLHYYKAGFFTGLNQLDAASKELKAAGNIPEFGKEMALLETEIEQRAGTGQYAFMFDRENLPVVNLTMKGQPLFLSDTVKVVLQNSAYDLLPRFTNRQNQAVLTLDYRIQNAALKALDKYAGAIVVLDVKKGDILAAASNLKGIHSNYPPETQLALLQQYEPGSIIKMITLSGALQKGVDFSKIFPVQCEGYLKLSQDHILYDWKKHDKVTDINMATAVSCNVVFARIGLSLKPADLLANLKQFGFNSRLQNNVLNLDLGKVVDGELNDLYLADLSIGLQNITMTPLHAAMLAASIANGGSLAAPRLLLNYRNVIGIPFGNTPVTEFRRFVSENAAEVVGHAMQEVVTNPDGTGRRAAVQGFPFAMKTGTAGEGEAGYNAVVIGFGPVPSARIAFAIVLEHAGKAEFEGARVTKLFLESIQGYI